MHLQQRRGLSPLTRLHHSLSPACSACSPRFAACLARRRLPLASSLQSACEMQRSLLQSGRSVDRSVTPVGLLLLPKASTGRSLFLSFFLFRWLSGLLLFFFSHLMHAALPLISFLRFVVVFSGGYIYMYNFFDPSFAGADTVSSTNARGRRAKRKRKRSKRDEKQNINGRPAWPCVVLY